MQARRVKVLVPKGGLLVWDSRMPHENFPNEDAYYIFSLFCVFVLCFVIFRVFLSFSIIIIIIIIICIIISFKHN